MEQWQDRWQPLASAVGTDFDDGEPRHASDPIERGAVRRYCEVVEMDFPLFFDEGAAQQHGHPNLLAPVSGIFSTWTVPAIWEPGSPTNFPTAGADDSPERLISIPPAPKSAATAIAKLMPRTNAGLAGSIELEFHREAYVGDELYVTGYRLLSVEPRETSVGRGAFITWEWDVLNQRDEQIATVRRTGYSYCTKESPDYGD